MSVRVQTSTRWLRSALEAVADGIGDDGISDDFDQIIDRQLWGEHRGSVDRALPEAFAEILRLSGRQLPHSEVVQDDRVGLGHLWWKGRDSYPRPRHYEDRPGRKAP